MVESVISYDCYITESQCLSVYQVYQPDSSATEGYSYTEVTRTSCDIDDEYYNNVESDLKGAYKQGTIR